MKTYDEIIQTRQNEIFNEVQDIDQEIQNLTARLEQLKARKQNRIEEHHMLQDIKDKGAILANRSGRASRIHIEDALKRILDRVGRPMRVSEILEGLEEFGYQWSNYHSAYSRVIVGIDMIQPAGMRGMYQLIRNK